MTDESKRFRKNLIDLTKAVSVFLARLDKEMELPSSPERGERIAALATALEMGND